MGPSACRCLPQRMWAMEATLGRAGVLARGYSFCRPAVWPEHYGGLRRRQRWRRCGSGRRLAVVVALPRLEIEGVLGLKVLGV